MQTINIEICRLLKSAIRMQFFIEIDNNMVQ